MSLALADQLYFCMVLEVSGLIIGLAISGGESDGGEVDIDFSEWS